MQCYLRNAICYGDGRITQIDISINYCNRFYSNFEGKEKEDVEADLEAVAGMLA